MPQRPRRQTPTRGAQRPRRTVGEAARRTVGKRIEGTVGERAKAHRR